MTNLRKRFSQILDPHQKSRLFKARRICEVVIVVSVNTSLYTLQKRRNVIQFERKICEKERRRKSDEQKEKTKNQNPVAAIFLETKYCCQHYYYSNYYNPKIETERLREKAMVLLNKNPSVYIVASKKKLPSRMKKITTPLLYNSRKFSPLKYHSSLSFRYRTLVTQPFLNFF